MDAEGAKFRFISRLQLHSSTKGVPKLHRYERPDLKPKISASSSLICASFGANSQPPPSPLPPPPKLVVLNLLCKSTNPFAKHTKLRNQLLVVVSWSKLQCRASRSLGSFRYLLRFYYQPLANRENPDNDKLKSLGCLDLAARSPRVWT